MVEAIEPVGDVDALWNDESFQHLYLARLVSLDPPRWELLNPVARCGYVNPTRRSHLVFPESNPPPNACPICLALSRKS